MHDCCEAVGAARTHSRRSFVRSVALGGGVALLFGPRALADDHECDVLLLSCIDFRLVQKTVDYMNSQRLERDYDHIALAGASLAALTEQKPAWGETFWQHVQTAIDLHKIKRVMVMDHRECGAYRTLLGDWVERDEETETEVHRVYLLRLREQISRRYSSLGVWLGLMDLKGNVQVIT